VRTIELQISFLPPYPFCTPERRSTSFSLSGPSWQPQEDRECLSPAETQTTPAPLPSDSTLAQDSPLTAQEMSDSTLTSPLEASWVSSQNDSPSDVSEGPEYLAIGNPAPHGRTASCESHSSNGESSSSHLFSSSSSQKLESAASSLGDQEEGRQSQAGSVLRRSSFSEGQTAPVASGTKKSHIRSHSDTNIASRGAAGKDEHQLLGSRVPLNSGGREDLLLRPSDGRGRRNVPA
jgi:run domain Beclin-1 interacting cysteine-rich containing protein